MRTPDTLVTAFEAALFEVSGQPDGSPRMNYMLGYLVGTILHMVQEEDYQKPSDILQDRLNRLNDKIKERYQFTAEEQLAKLDAIEKLREKNDREN